MKCKKRLIWLMFLAGMLTLCLFAGDAHATNYYSAESLTATNTINTTYAEKVQLQFTPGASDEQWVVVCTWRQCRVADTPDADYFAGKGRITVNGAARTGCDNITFKMRTNRWKSFGYFFKITGPTSEQTIGIDFAAYLQNFTYSIDKARIIAFKIPNPESADIHYSEWLTQETNTAYPTDHDTTFTPSSSGDYIWMAAGFHHEGPGGASSGGLCAVDPDSTIQQLSSETWIGGSDGFVQLFHVQKVTLTADSKTFKIRHYPDTTTGSHCQGLAQLVFRADAFNLVDYASSTAETYSNSTSYVTKLTLTTTSVGDTRDFIYLGTITKNFRWSSGESYAMYGQARVAGTQITEDITSSPTKVNNNQIPFVYAENCTGNRAVDYQYKTINASYEVMGRYAHLIALRYPPPNTAPSAPTIDNYNDGAWTNDSTPTLQFDMTDVDSGDIVKFQVQIDSGTSYPPDWASLTADYTETAGSPGYAAPRSDATWTVDPALSNSATSSTYYYWRVRGIDDDSAEGSWTAASNGFRVDTTIPSAYPTVKCTNYLSLSTNQWQNTISTPTLKWDGTDGSSTGTDALSQVNTSGYKYYWGTSVSGTPETTISTSFTPGSAVPSPSTYQLRFLVYDNAGNSRGPSTCWTHKYDATNPTITVTSIQEVTNTGYQYADTATHIWYNSNYSGSFAVHTSQNDQADGALMRKVVHPSLGTGWTGGGEDVSVGAKSSEADIYETYSWAASAAEPSTKTIYIYDGAIYTDVTPTGNSSSATFTVADDPIAPTAPTISLDSKTSTQIAVSASGGSDAHSGLWVTGGLLRYKIRYVQGTSYPSTDPDYTTDTTLVTDWAVAGVYTASNLTPNRQYVFRCWVRDNVSNTYYADLNLWTKPASADVLEANSRAVSTWYQGDGDTFTFSSGNLTSDNIGYYKYVWDTSASTAATGGTQWSSGTISVPNATYTKTNSKTLYLHVLSYNDNNEPASEGTQHYGPYWHVETKRLLKHGKFFDDDGNLIEMGPKTP